MTPERLTGGETTGGEKDMRGETTGERKEHEKETTGRDR